MMASTKVYDLAHAILDSVVGYYQAQNVPLPARRYVASGTPILDCEQVTVHVERSFANEGDAAAQVAQAIARHPGHSLRTVTFVISIWRCVPSPTTNNETLIPPTVAEEEDAAALILGDSVHLFNAMLTAERDGDLGGCNLNAILEWVGVGPQGGLGGGYLSVWIGLS